MYRLSKALLKHSQKLKLFGSIGFWIMNYSLICIGRFAPIAAKKMVSSFAWDENDLLVKFYAHPSCTIVSFAKNIEYFLAWEQERDMSSYK